MNKICCRCDQSLPADADFFYKRTRAKDGLQDWCIPCCDEYRRLIRLGFVFDRVVRNIPHRTNSAWDQVYRNIIREYFRRSNEAILARATHWRVE